MLVRRRGFIPGLPLAVAYVPRGPILDWTDMSLVQQVLANLEESAWRAGAIFVKIDPDVPGNSTAQEVREALTRRGWRLSAEQIQFRNTVVSDLSLPEASLLARHAAKCRYNIRLAERRGVTVRAGAAADLPAFYIMYLETGRRDGFLVRPYAYYQAIWETFLARHLAHLLLAEVEGTPVAGVLLFRFGPTAWYFYGASTVHARALMPNHALQWAALRWARSAGCRATTGGARPTHWLRAILCGAFIALRKGLAASLWLASAPTTIRRIGAYIGATVKPCHRVLDAARRRHHVDAPQQDNKNEVAQIQVVK